MLRYLLLLWLLLMTTFAMATQMFVVGEVFTQTWCGFCPSARSALNQMHQDPDQFPYLIPLIWQGDGPNPSPNYGGRGGLYGVSGIPHAQWGGSLNVVGGGTGVYNSYVARYNTVSAWDSPIEMEVSLYFDGQGDLVVQSDLELLDNITTSNNKILYIVTYDFTPQQTPDYFASVTHYAQQDFTLSSQGESGTFNHAFSIDPDWELEKMTGVIIVQTFDGNKQIHQAGSSEFTGLTPLFTTNVTTGPPSLVVHFEDQSLPAGGIESWEWDLNGDGSFDSTEQNPTFTYSEIGSYDVTLRIFDGEEYAEATFEDYITVTDATNISGPLSGIWDVDNSPYHITADATIKADNLLHILPGVEVQITNSRINVFGNLIANAEDADPIIFTSDTNWKGIKFNNPDHLNLLNNCEISNANQSAIIIDNGAQVDIIGNKIFNNHSNASGVIDLTSSDDVVIKKNFIANNTSNYSTGGIECSASSPLISNNIIVNNSGSYGALIFKNGSDATLINNTIANNLHGETGYLIFVFNSDPTIMNSILFESGELLFNAGGEPTITYSLVSGGFEGEGNIEGDPMFEAPTEGDGAEFDGMEALWYLLEDSPCIDAGNPDPIYNDIEDPNDPGNALWPAMGTVINDMGAFGGDGFIDLTSADDEIIMPVSHSNINIYPNPFNPNTTIALSISEQDASAPIWLDIYNIKGQKVRTLIKNTVPHNTTLKINWDGKDNLGQNVATGIYFANLKTASTFTSQKMILLK